MKTEKMRAELAEYYDLIYAWKDYRHEAGKIHGIIQARRKSEGNDLLDAACGTGSHIQHLRQNYMVTGMDLNREMLEIAKKKNPEIEFFQADMESFNLGKKFDVITCLFSSISYVKTYANLEKAIACFSRHLKAGGIMVIEPFFSPETFRDVGLQADFVNRENIKIARFHHGKKEGNMMVVDFHFLIGKKDGVRYMVDRHEMGLFGKERFLKIMEENGLKAEFTEDGLMHGRGLYIGTKYLH